MLKALGFYTYTCVPVPTPTNTTNSTTNTTTNTNTTSNTTVNTTTDIEETLANFTQPIIVPKSSGSKSFPVGLLVGVIVLVVLLICLSIGFVFYLLRRSKAMTKQNKVDAEELGDLEMFPEKTLGFNKIDNEIDPKSELKPTPRLNHEVACGPLEELDDERKK